MICNCRIVPAMQMALRVVLVEELPMEFHCALLGIVANRIVMAA